MYCEVCQCKIRNEETHFDSKKHIKKNKELYDSFSCELPELIVLVKNEIKNKELSEEQIKIKKLFIKALKMEIEEKRIKYNMMN